MLTPEQRAAFARDGFLVLEDLVPQDACAALMARADEICAAFRPEEALVFSTRAPRHGSADYFLSSGDKIRCFLEEDAVGPDGALRPGIDPRRAVNKIGHALHDLDPTFAAFSRQPLLAALAADLGLRQPLLLQSMYICKQPFIGGEVVCHQDATYLFTEPSSVIGLWFALEDATLDNGCLWALPGGHAEPLRARFRRGDGGARTEILDPRPLPMEGLVPLPVRQGGAVVLHGQLPHRSDSNRSPHSRHAYALHLIDGACHYPADNWLQRPDLPLRGFA